MQRTVVQNQINFNAKGPQTLNANSLVSSTQTKAQGKLSFANELIKVQQAAADSRSKPELANQEQVLNQASTTTDSTPKVQAGMATAMDGILSKEAEAKLKDLRNKEGIKEAQKALNSEEVNQDSQELHSKYNSSETTMASAGQDHHNKQATEAVREGNVAEQQQAAHDHSRERKRQLANWEDLAPRIIEDPKNRAVRIDIPGLVDLETIIVRIRQGEVSIQTVGEKKTMEKLQSHEAILSKKLRDQNIKLGSLQTFDAAVVTSGAQQKQA